MGKSKRSTQRKGSKATKVIKKEVLSPVKNSNKIGSVESSAPGFGSKAAGQAIKKPKFGSEPQFQVGDKVFAKVKTCPQPWPAKIVQNLSKRGVTKFLVHFYGTYDSEEVKADQLYSYDPETIEKFGKSLPFYGATLFQNAMKEIQTKDPSPSPRARSQNYRPQAVVLKPSASSKSESESDPDSAPASYPLPSKTVLDTGFDDQKEQIQLTFETSVPETTLDTTAESPIAEVSVGMEIQTQTDPQPEVAPSKKSRRGQKRPAKSEAAELKPMLKSEEKVVPTRVSSRRKTKRVKKDY